MSSSDSCDDFESADEDFSETESSRNKTHHKPGEMRGEVLEVKQAEPPDKNTEHIDELMNNIKIDNRDNHQTSRYTDLEPQHVNTSFRLDNCDKSKPKPVKKLGSKINNKLVNPSELHFKEEVRNDHMKDTDCDSINDNTSLVKTIDASNTNKNVNMEIVPDKSLQELNSNSEKLILNKSQSSDGWDVEEEDGFDIPSELAKPNPSGASQFGNKEQQEHGWGGWGGWGVSSLLTTATDSVSTFSSQVTAGLSTVLETTVGAPEPEKLAAAIQLHQNEPSEHEKVKATSNSEGDSTSHYGGLGSLMSGVSLLGSSVINRGLDTLESLGKKTMEVLQEGDPGLKKKRAMLFANQDKPVLSHILREAKEKAEHSDKEKEEKEMARKVHFESLFDDFQGMVHLEALEMLSTQCELKLQSLLLGESGSALEDLQETLSQVRDLCELSDEEDETEVLTHDQLAEQVTKCVGGLRVNITAVKIIQVNQSVISSLEQLARDSETATVVHQTAISTLAKFTAAAMECFHKSAELLMAKTLHNTADEAEHYVQLTNLLCARVSAMANEFTQLLTKNHPIANSSLIMNIFLEASNSSSYMRNACQLLVPILQVGAVAS